MRAKISNHRSFVTNTTSKIELKRKMKQNFDFLWLFLFWPLSKSGTAHRNWGLAYDNRGLANEKRTKAKTNSNGKKWLKNIMKKIPENFNENMAWQTTMLGFSTELCLLKSCGTWGWRRWLIAILCVCAQRIDFSFYLL